MHLKYQDTLPISKEKNRIVDSIRAHQVLIIAGDTGSGKTTQLPKMCLEAELGKSKLIGCTQPRRLAAMAMARRVAEELQSPDLVGSTVRFQDRTGPDTRIKFMTDGILLAETRRDRRLQQYDAIILDEAHERSLNIDFLLGYLQQLLPLRPEFKLIIASATIDTEKFSTHFDSAPIIHVSGKTFPVTIEYRTEQPGAEPVHYVDKSCDEVLALCRKPGGDILVFMPSERDILDTVTTLQDILDADRHLVLPLFSRLQSGDQQKIFRASGKRKIIVATNVAETSLTVPGIRFVIDTGLARIPVYSVRSRTTSLRISPISRASCDQRAGRCGRTGPGTCIRLYDEEAYQQRMAFTRPEIQRSNLAEVLLQMISLGLGHPRHFPFLDPPSPRAVNDGFRILRELGAITNRDQLTARGKIMARLPLDPCIARIIVEGKKQNALNEIITICAALSIQDPRMRPAEKIQQAQAAQQQFTDNRSDFLTLLAIWNSWQKYSNGTMSSGKLRKFCNAHYLSWQRMREWSDVRQQINRLLKPITGFLVKDEPASYEAIHKALTSGFLRNIGKKKAKNLYTVSRGREVVIFPGSCLYNAKQALWVMAAEFIETSQRFARTTARIDEQWLEELGGPLCKYSYSDPHWSKKAGQVRAIERVSLFGLPIVAGRGINYGRLNKKTQEEAREIFIHEALIAGELGGSYPFLHHNLSLIEKISTMEERLRRRNILVDDRALQAFYHQRIGSAYDRFTLNRLLRKKKKDTFLRMSEHDLCREELPAEDELYRFPKILRVGEIELPLAYRFAPGTEEDGVTVTLRSSQLPALSPTPFEWLVPGLLDTKILHLLKALPKKKRRPLVPLPDAVDRIMDQLDLNKGSLYQALETALLRSYQIPINRSDWQTETMPKHLLMRYRLVDEQNKDLRTSRNFTELLEYNKDYCKQIYPPERLGTKKRITLPKKDNMTTWDFEDLSEYYSTTDASGNKQVYCLGLHINSDNKVDLRYTENPRQAEVSVRAGMEQLYCLQFPGCRKKIVTECKRSLATHSASWLSLGMPGTAMQLRESLVRFILDGLFHTRAGNIPSQPVFNHIVTTLKQQGIMAQVSHLLAHTERLLHLRRHVVTALTTWQSRQQKSKSFHPAQTEDITKHLETLLPSDFLLVRSPAQLQHCDRYLQALKVRIERMEQNPLKDQQKQKRLTIMVNRFDHIKEFSSHDKQCSKAKELYTTMVEEFRVSVFAPELGTALPVSEKRLTKQWQEVINHCRQVE